MRACSVVLTVVINFVYTKVFTSSFRAGTSTMFFSAGCKHAGTIGAGVLTKVIAAIVVCYVKVVLLDIVYFKVVKADNVSAPCRVCRTCDVCVVSCKRCCLLAIMYKFVTDVLTTSISVLMTTGVRAVDITIYVPFFLCYLLPFVKETLSKCAALFGLVPAVLAGMRTDMGIPLVCRVKGYMFQRVPLMVMVCAIVTVTLLPFVCGDFHECKGEWGLCSCS